MSDHYPRVGDKFWDEVRRNEGKQPNGKITYVDRESHIVLVTWQDNTGQWTEYDFDHISDHYVNETMGYMLHDYS